MIQVASDPSALPIVELDPFVVKLYDPSVERCSLKDKLAASSDLSQTVRVLEDFCPTPQCLVLYREALDLLVTIEDIVPGWIIYLIRMLHSVERALVELSDLVGAGRTADGGLRELVISRGLRTTGSLRHSLIVDVHTSLTCSDLDA